MTHHTRVHTPHRTTCTNEHKHRKTHPILPRNWLWWQSTKTLEQFNCFHCSLSDTNLLIRTDSKACWLLTSSLISLAAHIWRNLPPFRDCCSISMLFRCIPVFDFFIFLHFFHSLLPIKVLLSNVCYLSILSPKVPLLSHSLLLFLPPSLALSVSPSLCVCSVCLRVLIWINLIYGEESAQSGWSNRGSTLVIKPILPINPCHYGPGRVQLPAIPLSLGRHPRGLPRPF